VGLLDKVNPLAKMNKLKASLPDIGKMQSLARNQNRQVEIQVKEILKQTVLMERWANAAEALVEQDERKIRVLNNIAKAIKEGK